MCDVGDVVYTIVFMVNGYYYDKNDSFSRNSADYFRFVCQSNICGVRLHFSCVRSRRRCCRLRSRRRG